MKCPQKPVPNIKVNSEVLRRPPALWEQVLTRMPDIMNCVQIKIILEINLVQKANNENNEKRERYKKIRITGYTWL